MSHISDAFDHLWDLLRDGADYDSAEAIVREAHDLDTFEVHELAQGYADARHSQRNADRIDGYDRDDLGESPDY